MDNFEKYKAAMAVNDYAQAIEALKAEKGDIKKRNEPNEIVYERGKPLKFKRRGRIVELADDGVWYPKGKGLKPI